MSAFTSETGFDGLAGDRGARPSAELVTRGYRECAAITRRFGTTYYWGTILLPPARRRQVHAVYALCRLADDIVDAPGATTSPQLVPQTAAALTAYADRFRAAVAGEIPVTEPVLAAIVDTARATRIDPECFERFFSAMALDLTQGTYGTWDDLLAYMDGSAAVIGEMMLPVLRPLSPDALGPARSLGLAFQVTNFLRDIAEDLDRGRVYLPQDELAAFGADPADRRVTPAWRAFMAHQIERNRALYVDADRGLALLPPSSARCVGAARVLYARILDRIEAADYDVFASRARVPTWSKAATSLRIAVTGPRT